MPGTFATPLDLSCVQIPHHFRCPISLELMRDPVTVSTGQTYERSSIESWISTGNITCPVTRSPLSDFTLIPNHTLRRLIQQWSLSLGLDRIPSPKQPPDISLLRSLLARSSSHSAPLPSRLASLRRLRSLSLDSDRTRLLLSDFRSAILHLAFGEGQHPDIAIESLALLSTLPLGDSECSAVAARPDRVAWISRLLTHESAEVRASASALIEAVCAGTRSAELKMAVGGADGVMEGLVAMLKQGPRAAAVRGVFGLCLEKGNRGRAVEAGVAEALVDALGKSGVEDRGDLERALAALELLCRVEGGAEAMGREGAVGAMVDVMEGRAWDRAAEHAAAALVVACEVSEAARKEAVERGVVPHLLVMVQGGCTDRAKRKAQALLKMLLEAAWPRGELLLGGNSDELFQFPQRQPALLPY